MAKTNLQLPQKSIFVILPVLFISLILNIYYYLQLQNNKVDITPQDYTVSRVVDGDTFDVNGDIRIRLAGADAPEYPEGCLSEETKQRLNELVAGRTVEIVQKEKDDFGRIVGYTWIDDLFVDKALVSEGLAQASNTDDPRYGALLSESQEEAQNAQRGIWSSQCTSPPDPNCTIKGNIRRDLKTKVYHLSNCFNYQKTVIDTSEGDQWFCSEDEAVEAGFTKSEDCPGN